jgi:hypothetical protein
VIPVANRNVRILNGFLDRISVQGHFIAVFLRGAIHLHNRVGITLS